MNQYVAFLVVLCLLGAVLGIMGIISSRKCRRGTLPNSAMPGNGWTNTAIRRQGSSGKGIR